MKWKSSSRKICLTEILLIIVMIDLIAINTSILTNNTIVPSSTAANPTIQWYINLTIDEPNGAGYTVVFGEATNASDGQDSYDIPAPPTSPQLPVIIAWFETSFPVPFNNLFYEYKHYPSINTSWNLSILWLPGPGNTISTNITIHWDASQILKNTNITLFLYENNTILTNMLTTNSYSYITNSTVHGFQIISQNQPSNSSLEQNKIQIPSLLIYILVILIIIILATLLLYKRRNKSQVTQIEPKKSHETENKSQVTQIEPKSHEEGNKSQVTEIKPKKSPKKKTTSQVTKRKQKKSPKKSQRKKQ
jgi:hypothetical protein